MAQTPAQIQEEMRHLTMNGSRRLLGSTQPQSGQVSVPFVVIFTIPDRAVSSFR